MASLSVILPDGSGRQYLPSASYLCFSNHWTNYSSAPRGANLSFFVGRISLRRRRISNDCQFGCSHLASFVKPATCRKGNCRHPLCSLLQLPHRPVCFLERHSTVTAVVLRVGRWIDLCLQKIGVGAGKPRGTGYNLDHVFRHGGINGRHCQHGIPSHSVVVVHAGFSSSIPWSLFGLCLAGDISGRTTFSGNHHPSDWLSRPIRYQWAVAYPSVELSARPSLSSIEAGLLCPRRLGCTKYRS